MQFKTSFVSLVALALGTVPAQGTLVQFYRTAECDGSSLFDSSTLQCNVCVDPDLGFFNSVRVSAVTAAQNIRFGSGAGCTVLEGQFVAPQCRTPPPNTLRWVNVLCAEKRFATSNETTSADQLEVVEEEVTAL